MENKVLQFPKQGKQEAEYLTLQACNYCGWTEFTLWLGEDDKLTAICTECGK